MENIYNEKKKSDSENNDKNENSKDEVDVEEVDIGIGIEESPETKRKISVLSQQSEKNENETSNMNIFSVKKNKGWNFLYETLIKQSSGPSMKYGSSFMSNDTSATDTSTSIIFTLSSTNTVPRDEEIQVSQVLSQICNMRDEYIKEFPQFNPSTVQKPKVSEKDKKERMDDTHPLESSEPQYNPYNIKLLPNCNAFINYIDGVFFVHWNHKNDTGPLSVEECTEENKLISHRHIKSVEEFILSLNIIMSAVQDPACKSFCYQRLKYLEQKFDFHIMFNGSSEMKETEKIKHRDFYNIRKVDTHVHHSACMQQKVLLRFIREKYKTEADTVVYKNEKGDKIALKDIFKHELNNSAYDVTIDNLAVHALGDCFHRFDLFNQKYNPFGQRLLRDIFLKTDNYIEGRYLAEMTKNEIQNLEDSKYQHVEWRISIYGKTKNEWSKLAKWVLNNKLSSVRVRWVIQVPRLYHVYRKMNLIKSFAEFLSNVFEPCFKAVKHPEQHKEIFMFLHQVVAWDSVDDESLVSKFTMEGGDLPTPANYTHAHNPPYSYYAYYMYANIRSLNEFMVMRNMRPIMFRPHCGEVGSVSHLASMFLLADGINHGINLRKSPVLMYLYYLKQIGLAISPLSNNALFLQIEKHPFHTFFKVGLNVSLSTDDPLMFHFTSEPLLEEYSICAHIWKLSTVDLCEIARNSVLQSGFEPAFKTHWIGYDFKNKDIFQSNPNKSNIPQTRMNYRRDTLKEENDNIKRLLTFRKERSESA